MIEELNFQDFGMRAPVTHRIDPSVVIDIFEALQEDVNSPLITGVLMGKQEGDRLSVEHVLVTQFCYIEDKKIVKDQDLGTLIQYHQQLYSLDVVGW